MAMLELRMKLNSIDGPELKALCDEMLRDDAMDAAPAREAPRQRPLLRLVK